MSREGITLRHFFWFGHMISTQLNIAIVSKRSLIRELVTDYCSAQGFNVVGSFASLMDIDDDTGDCTILLHVTGGDSSIVREIDLFQKTYPDDRIIAVCSRQIHERAMTEISPKVEALIVDDSSLRALTGVLTLVQEGFRLTPPPAPSQGDTRDSGQSDDRMETATPFVRGFETEDDGGDDSFEEEASHAEGARPRALSKLSSRERAVIRKLREGASNKDIAKDLDIGESTVKVHLRSCYRKIGVRNRTQAAMWVTKHIPN